MSSYNSDDLQRLEPAYLDSYGLAEAPFSSLAQDKFTFLDAERAQRINMLQHMVRYSNLLLIVQGKSGVGKTTLMRRFMQTAEDDWRVCEVAANTMIDAEQLLYQAAQGFGVSQLPQNAGELQEMLFAQVSTFHHNDQIPILIIDDAHELPKDALLAIFNLADAFVNDVNLLRIILFCEPQIEKILNSKDVKALRERVTHTMDVPAFDEDTTAEYIKHRLAVAGFNGATPFSPKVIKKIYRGSNGIAAKINTLAHEFLGQGEIPLTIPDMVVEVEERKQGKPYVVVAALIMVVTLVLVFQDNINQLFKGGDSEDKTALLDKESLSDSPVGADNLSAGTEPDKSAETDKNEDKEQITKEINITEKIISLAEENPETEDLSEQAKTEVPSNEQPVSVAEVATDVFNSSETLAEEAVEEKVAERAPLVIPQIASITPAVIPISRAQQSIVINGTGFNANSQVVIGWTGKQKQLSDSQTRLISDTKIEIAITVGMNEDDWTLKVNTPKAGESNVFTFKVADTQIDKGYRKDKWLLGQNPEAFTLQLFGTNKPDNADQFINQHKISQRAGYFYTKSKGQDWYSVVYGQYENQSLASAAAKKLPASLKKIKPWVRRLDDIQASINANRKPLAKSKPKAAIKSKPKTTTKSAPITPKDSADASESQAWLWSQDPSNYTLQLLGARQSDSIQKFLRKHTQLNGKAVYFHTRHDTRNWYAVVYGVYSDRSQAAKAIKRLPKELQSASPWIRSFGSIHAELDRTE